VPSEHEEKLLMSVALQTARSIHLARRRAEAELQRQSEWLRVALGSIGDGVISTDPQGRVTFMNPAAEALCGWSQAEAQGRPLTDVCEFRHEQTRVLLDDVALRALEEESGDTPGNDIVLISRDGSERPIEKSAAPMRSETGTVIGTVLVFRDETDRKRAEAARARLAAIVEASDDAIVSKTLSGVIQSWNAGAERLFGYSQVEAIGQPITLIIPAERLGEEREILDRLCRGERIDHFETVRVAKDGRLLDISLTVSPVFDRQGRVTGASKIARDITDRKRVENALRESEEHYRRAAAEAARAAEANAKFRAFLEQGTNFAGVLALDGTLIEANRLCLEACGFKREEALGKRFWECAWWNCSGELMQMVEMGCRQAAAGQVFRRETKYHVAGGAQGTVDLTLAPVTDTTGRVLFVAATGTDITDRRIMEDELREQDRRKDEFLALLAHELRNPLAPLRNGLQALRLSHNDARVVERMRIIMERQLQHMVRLIDDLLDISRINRNQLHLRRIKVSLADVVQTAIETSRPIIDACGHELFVSLPSEPIWLDADPTRLAQVFDNLLTNSARYTPSQGHIWLTGSREGQTLVVSVRDDGIGIPQESLQSIFEMFAQVEPRVERSSGGLGIGLAIVKRLVEMHGGAVSAESRGPGAGSTFAVRLPIVETRPEPDPTATIAQTPCYLTTIRRLLVVDDNRDSATSLADVFKLSGVEVCVANDGAEAVRAAEEFQPELILMDVGMPRLNGYQASRQIREQAWGERPIIIALTGWGQEADRFRSRQAGCDGHLVKPVELEELGELLKSLKERPPSEDRPRLDQGL
jgi:PAS domain S-box-containing protein